MSFPADGDVAFFVCEDVRHEEGGKFSLIGISTSGRIDITRANDADPNTPPIISRLSLFFTFRTGEGKYKSRIRLASPSGKKIAEVGGGDELEKSAEKACNIFLSTTSFPVNEFGTYKVDLILNDREYVRTFSLNLSTKD